MSLFKRKKEINLNDVVATKTIKHMEEIMALLIRKDRYFYKPYSLEEIKKVLLNEKTVYAYIVYNDKKYLLGHIYNYSTLVKTDKYFFQNRFFNSLETLFSYKTIDNRSLDELWYNVDLKIMIDEKDNQVL